LSDAIVVGAGTVAADDPQLTTRNVTGPSPVRVILDTNRRLPPDCRVFREGPETILACAEDSAGVAKPDRCTLLKLPRAAQGKADRAANGAPPGLDPHALLAALCARGLRRVFVEGGGITVSRFLAAGALDRLHLTVAPLLLGSGIPAFTLPVAARPDDGLRITWTVHPLGRDLLFDIPLRRARPGICR
jgi:riboflavin-specific deaminase-like protein